MSSRDQAIASVRASLGLPDDDTAWTYDQRISYNRALSQYISANPQIFTQTDLDNASATLNQNPTALQDTGILGEAGDFVSAFGDELESAANDVGSIGRGVLNLASFGKWLIPLVGVIMVIILLFAFRKKVKA